MNNCALGHRSTATTTPKRRYELLNQPAPPLYFRARGYFVSTVGIDEGTIREYIRHQETNDKKVDQQRLF